MLIVDASQGGGAGVPWQAIVTAIPSGTQLTLDAVPTVVAHGWTLAASDRVTLYPTAGSDGVSASGYQRIEAANIAPDSATSTTNRWV